MEREIEDIRQGADEQRLGQPRRTSQEAMPAAEQSDEELPDDILLSHDDLGQFCFDLIPGLSEPLHRFFFQCVIHDSVQCVSA